MIIQELELYTAQLEAQTEFYSKVLELEIIERSDSSVSFQLRNSILRFSYRKECIPYHYAINIPANKEQEALAWLKERVEILTDEGKEIQRFEAWDANAIYFYDKDKNIGELIARKRLKNESAEVFTAASMLELSEIGVPTSDIAPIVEALSKLTGIQIHSGSLERFCSLGDDKGLFILLNMNEKKEWFPTNDTPRSADFKLRFAEQGKEYNVEYKGEELLLS